MSTRKTNWRDEYKRMEQSFMSLSDKYNELARNIGFEGVPPWNDVIATHEEILERLSERIFK